jgi:hypothetical protein
MATMRSRTTDYTDMARIAQKWLQLKKIVILSISILLHTIANQISNKMIYNNI